MAKKHQGQSVDPDRLTVKHILEQAPGDPGKGGVRTPQRQGNNNNSNRHRPYLSA
jgi:hypothetical protein